MLIENEDDQVGKRETRSSLEVMRYVGSEPSWIDVTEKSEDYNTKYATALNYANYVLDDEALKNNTLIYFKDKNLDISMLEHAKPWRFLVIGKFCWLVNNGCPIKASTKEFINEKVKELQDGSLEDFEATKPEESVRKIGKVELKQLLSATRLSNLIALIDNEIDNMCLTDVEADIYTLLNGQEVESVLAKEIKQHYSSEHDLLLNELTSIKNNVEWNSNLSTLEDELEVLESDELDEEIESYKLELQKHIEAVEHIQWQVGSYLGNNKAKRTTSKIRSKRILNQIEKSTKNLNFKTHDSKFKVQSIPLDRIIGAQLLITFNTSNRKMCLYYAADATGLQIKGTTILNFDDKKSGQKTLRQPEHLLSHLQQNSDHRASVVFKGLSTKAVAPNGRINKYTILLKSFKELTKVK